MILESHLATSIISQQDGRRRARTSLANRPELDNLMIIEHQAMILVSHLYRVRDTRIAPFHT